MIFLASPYSHHDPSIRLQRYYAALQFTVRAVAKGIPLFSPIVYGHCISQHAAPLPYDAEYWEKINDPILSSALELWVLQLDGWQQSLGVTREIEIALSNYTPVLYKVLADADNF